MIGNASGQKYATKYVIDLAMEPVITEIRILQIKMEFYAFRKNTAVMLPMEQM